MTPVDRENTPAPGPTRPFHLEAAVGESLANGLRVRTLARAQVPLVSGCLVLDAGETGIAAGSEGLAVLAGDALHGGTERRSAGDFAEAMERMGTAFSVSTGWDAATVTFTCVADRLDPVLAYLSEMVQLPSYPEEEVGRVREQRLAAIRQRRMEPAQLADDELDRTAFVPEHPYHRPLSGTAESVGALTAEAARSFAKEAYVPGRGGLALVGDLDPKESHAIVSEHFAGWDDTYPGRRVLRLATGPAPRRIVLVDRPGAVQSEIRIGHPAPARGDANEEAIRVANTIFGGAFTSRLNLNLREEHGFTYGVRSRFALRRNGGAFTIATATATEVTGAALREIVSELERFHEEGPTTDEVDRARDYLAGIFPLQMETTAQLAARVAEILIFDLPDDYHVHARERIRSVDRATATEAAREHFRPHEAAVVVVGDAERLEGEIDALGLGPVERIPA